MQPLVDYGGRKSQPAISIQNTERNWKKKFYRKHQDIIRNTIGGLCSH